MPVTYEQLLEKISPENIRRNLVRAGLLLAGWEVLKKEVEDQLRDFYMLGLKADPLAQAAYETSVLSRHKWPFEASLLWLIESGALDEKQAQQVRDLRNYRNEVAHEIPKFMIEFGCDANIERIREARDLIVILGRFWGRISVDVNPDFDADAVNDEDIHSGMSMLMNLLVGAAEDV